MKNLIYILNFTLIISCQHTKSDQKEKISFSVSNMAICEDLEFKASCYDDIRTKQNLLYYDRNVLKTDSSLIVTFDFIEDCSLKYTGSYELIDEVLYLSYFLTDDENIGAECKCNYRMIYQFKNLNEHWKRIKIKKLKSK